MLTTMIASLPGWIKTLNKRLCVACRAAFARYHLCVCLWWPSPDCPSACRGPGSPVGVQRVVHQGPAPPRNLPRSAYHRWTPPTPRPPGPMHRLRQPHRRPQGPGRSPAAGHPDSLHSAAVSRQGNKTKLRNGDTTDRNIKALNSRRWRRLTAMPRAFRMFILHMGQVRWSSSHGSTQLLWKRCLQSGNSGRRR